MTACAVAVAEVNGVVPCPRAQDVSVSLLDPLQDSLGLHLAALLPHLLVPELGKFPLGVEDELIQPPGPGLDRRPPDRIRGQPRGPPGGPRAAAPAGRGVRASPAPRRPTVSAACPAPTGSRKRRVLPHGAQRRVLRASSAGRGRWPPPPAA